MGRYKCGIYDDEYVYQGIDLERFKELFKTDKFYGMTSQDYLENILCYNGYNDTLESINQQAEIIEAEYERYNFDIYNSEIGDLVKTSNARNDAIEASLEIIRNPDKFIIKNTKTGETRSISITQLESGLTECQDTLTDFLYGANKRVLWEFAAEVKSLDSNPPLDSAGSYEIDTDTVNINDSTNVYSFTHEMCHAIMATVIDGKNTFNETLYKEFKDTYEQEQKEHELKGLRRFGAGGYNYCAENIHEFAAEAGCLYLTGDSGSAFTIAKHFPKSYRIFVTLIEQILSSDEKSRNIYADFMNSLNNSFFIP